ncbi:leucine-rich repeat and immunoglobulin-like domain containing-NOGO receptor-interacting protein 4 [Schistocerca nitens]|uniref:leucine-rich repeat and immunoglobulin-like domain containing-NOGO receptor-interacting protein 4 n=1 Tax=Schistocerca nitens TaxID=7011 RepID=UPI002117CDB6|nr:leucine-rich repeat and immunoglobulin-like domain containing-NOGO receptor-interacting protein 4 [Schistocerca nitens]
MEDEQTTRRWWGDVRPQGAAHAGSPRPASLKHGSQQQSPASTPSDARGAHFGSGQPPPPRQRRTAGWRSASCRWRPLAVLGAALALSLLAADSAAAAICPSKCQCDDETLEASCTDANLEVVPIQLNPDVKRINLQGNRISNVHFTLDLYSNLRHLDLSRNRISSLGTLNFKLQTKLVTLNFSRNDITSLSKDTFNGLKSVQVLDLSYNQLSSLEGAALAELGDLRALNLTGNRVSAVGERALERLPQLRELLLDDNQLLDVPAAALRRLPALQRLGLADNLIEAVAEGALPALRDLRALTLRRNVLSSIDRAAFDGVQSLQSLDVSDNNLTSVPTSQLSKLADLVELDLSGNTFDTIEAVSFQSLFELRQLRLSRLRQLRRVDVRAFVDNIKLQSVELDDNERLSSLPPRLFHGNPALERVSARGNAFTALEAEHFPLDRLRALSLAGNPLHCNCSLLWLWLLARKQRDAPPPPPPLQASAANLTTLSAPGATAGPSQQPPPPTPAPDITPRLDVDGIRCHEPEALRGLLIVDVPESDVRCDASWLAVIIVTVVVMALFAVTCGLLLVMGNWKWCRKKEEQLAATTDTHHHSHLQNGAVLMLVSGKDRPPDAPSAVDTFRIKAKKEEAAAAAAAAMSGGFQHRPLPPCWDEERSAAAAAACRCRSLPDLGAAPLNASGAAVTSSAAAQNGGPRAVTYPRGRQGGGGD